MDNNVKIAMDEAGKSFVMALAITLDCENPNDAVKNPAILLLVAQHRRDEITRLRERLACGGK